MKITTVEPIVVRIPFEYGNRGGEGIMPGWVNLDTVLVRVETDTGLVGWGEAFGYFCYSAVSAAIRDLIGPRVIGQELTDPSVMNLSLQRQLALFGRYGITIFALSGIDIALWDLYAKQQGSDLASVLAGGHRRRDQVAAYASLLRYANESLIAEYSAKAEAEGYATIKLHEIDMAVIRASRSALDPATRFTVDVNNGWSIEKTRSYIPELIDLDTWWLEEPIFPPEDWPRMRQLAKLGQPLSAGENACTAMEFRQLIPAVEFPQPSVTKIGGVSEFIAAATLAAEHNKSIKPHSPYFGPGYFASLQLAAALDAYDLFEYLYVEPQAWVGMETPLPTQHGIIQIPRKPGIGFEPDPEVLAQYRFE